MPNFAGSLPLAFLVIAGVCAPLAGWLAMQRSRNPVLWFAYGALIGPLAPLLLVAAPVGRCPRCETPAAGWSATCTACGTRLGGLLDDGQDATGTRATTASSPAMDTLVAATPTWATPTAPTPAAPTVTAAEAAPSMASTSPVATGGVASLRARAPESAPIPTADRARITSDTASIGEVLATAVYLSGNAGLEIGACYAIARVDDRIRVFGPVDTGQLIIRYERPIDDGEVVALDDRLIITLRRGRRSTSMIMRWVGGMAPSRVEAALAPGSREGQTTDGMRR